MIKRIPPGVMAGGVLAVTLLAWNQGGWKWVSDRTEFLGAAIGVAMFGVLGAFVSANRRMAPPPIEASSFGAWFSLRQFYNATKFALVLGGIFAIIWWFLMLGGVIEGTAFPKFQPGRALPDSMASWALLAIWSFLAGFAERLVLDTLDKFASTGAPIQFARTQASDTPKPAGVTNGTADAEGTPSRTEAGEGGERHESTTAAESSPKNPATTKSEAQQEPRPEGEQPDGRSI